MIDAAVGVVLRVGGEDEQHVERQAHREAADLEVALLEQVEQADLDARREVGQLVDREDAAVGARDDAEVDDLGVGVGEPAGRRLDRVDVAEQVGDRDVRRRELLVVARLAWRATRSAASSPASAIRRAGPGRDRRERVVVDLAAGEHRNLRRRAGWSSARRMRVFAWPRRPSRMKSWPASSALTTAGMTVRS